MSSRNWLILMLIAWAICFGMSFLHSSLAAPTGDGFGRGLNKLGIFFGWQGGALLLALICLVIRISARDTIQGALRWISFIPIGSALLLVLAIVGVIIMA